MVNYRKQMGALITGQMLSLLLGFVLPLFLVRVLSKHDYGLYAQLNVILSFCTVFFSLGFSSELYYSYPTASEKEKKVLVSQSFALLVLSGLIACILLYIPAIKQHVTSDQDFLSLYNYLTFAVLFSVPEIIITVLYVLTHDNRASTFFLPAMTILRVALILGAYLICPTIKSVFIAVSFAVFFKFVYVLFYTLRVIWSHKGEEFFSIEILKQQLNYSLPLGLASSTRVLVQQLDKLIILSFVSPAVYAIYSIAFYGVPGLTQVYLSISQVYIPRMAASFKGADLKTLLALYHSMVLKTLSYTIPMIFIIMLFADPIIPFLFSDKYVDSIPYFQIYLLTFIVQSVGCGNILRATGETKYSLRAYIYTAIVMIPFTYFAIKYFYLNGAIVSATIGAILPKLILTVYDARVIHTSLSLLFPWKKISKIVVISLVCIIPFCLFSYVQDNISFGVCIFLISFYLIAVFVVQMYCNVFIISLDELKLYINRYLLKK